MVLYQAEYMVGGTCWLPSKAIENQVRAWGRLAIKDGNSTIERISEKNVLRSQFDGGSCRFSLTREVAVILEARQVLCFPLLAPATGRKDRARDMEGIPAKSGCAPAKLFIRPLRPAA